MYCGKWFFKVTSFKICNNLIVSHTAGVNGAPVSKTVTYHTISSSLSGAARCWITQNLGSDQQAGIATDGTDASSGWYWQFNRVQAYQYSGSRLPAGWNGTNDGSNSWLAGNDPCNLLLGIGWRLPTATETATVIGGWTGYGSAYASVLKLHASGYLNMSNGLIYSRGAAGAYWSSTQGANSAWGNSMNFGVNYTNTAGDSYQKASGLTVRCLKN